jgi:hypothetical protein
VEIGDLSELEPTLNASDASLSVFCPTILTYLVLEKVLNVPRLGRRGPAVYTR